MLPKEMAKAPQQPLARHGEWHGNHMKLLEFPTRLKICFKLDG
jgi:hypothetical protein